MILNDNYGHGGDVYKNSVLYDFSANVNPLGTPQKVKEAVSQAAEKLAIYPDPYCTELRKKLSREFDVPEKCVICGNGAAELIFQLVLALMPKNTLLPVPSFSEYESALAAFGGKPRLYILQREHGFALTEDFLDEITPDTDLLMLCTPNNPTGLCVPKELMDRIIARCRETGTWLLLDECFVDLTDEDKAYSVIPSLRENDKIFVLRAFTKLYGMAGARLGFGICRNGEIMEKMCRLVQPWNVSVTAQAAGAAALDCREFVQKTKELIYNEKKYLMAELEKLGISFIPGQANYLMLSGVPGLYEKLLEKKILIRRCANYHGLDEGDCRIAVRTHEENAALIAALREIYHA